ncbi:Dipeptide transport system permease protein DppC [Desulfamplus magnetovallimortis]|uniref:Dipeptide transport system permease protein DppC n=1 Tax=Desulfamplus magnetovallimortis TaxID=1246637 RepID=A0A1W1HIX2_9BACT|nr:ABC transporter permease [Desulfamplus magnetovallimortis]SLM32355.1 Dipeptide transport system permease protein DppC [Desulfamplus magnetovallimortis]
MTDMNVQVMKKIVESKYVYSFLRDPSAIIGTTIMVIFIFAALFAPVLSPMDPYDLEKIDLGNFLIPPAWMDGGSFQFPLGTDDQGRGILSTILYGLRTSLFVGFSVVVISTIIGIVLGMLAGYYGGILDSFVMRMADTVFAFSTTLLAVLLLGVFESRGLWTVVLAICIADWVKYARTIRGSVLEIRDNAYVVAAKASGAKDFRILFRHILPNALPPIFVVLAVDLAVVIMLEATLSFLGVGVPITEPSLGMMIAIGKNYIYAGMWWMILFPGATLILLVVAINLFSDWLRDELNPKLAR